MILSRNQIFRKLDLPTHQMHHQLGGNGKLLRTETTSEFAQNIHFNRTTPK